MQVILMFRSLDNIILIIRYSFLFGIMLPFLSVTMAFKVGTIVIKMVSLILIWVGYSLNFVGSRYIFHSEIFFSILFDLFRKHGGYNHILYSFISFQFSFVSFAFWIGKLMLTLIHGEIKYTMRRKITKENQGGIYMKALLIVWSPFVADMR